MGGPEQKKPEEEKVKVEVRLDTDFVLMRDRAIKFIREGQLGRLNLDTESLEYAGKNHQRLIGVLERSGREDELTVELKKESDATARVAHIILGSTMIVVYVETVKKPDTKENEEKRVKALKTANEEYKKAGKNERDVLKKAKDSGIDRKQLAKDAEKAGFSKFAINAVLLSDKENEMQNRIEEIKKVQELEAIAQHRYDEMRKGRKKQV